MVSAHDIRVMHLAAPGRTGGLETVLEQLSIGLRAKQLDVRVALVIPPGEERAHPLVEALEKANVPVHCVLVGGRSYRAERRAVRDLMEMHKIQILHTHGYRADVVSGGVARAARLAHVTTLHGFIGATRRGRFYEWLQVRSAIRADAAIAVSAPIAARLKGAGAENVRLIPNAIAPLQEHLSRSEARSALGLSAQATVVGWIGRASIEKGLDVLVRALSHTDNALTAVVIGDGPELNAAKQLASELGLTERIRFCGLMPRASRYLAALDAVALTSRTEGTPMVLLEAMWAGIPIVSTGVGGVVDLVGNTAIVCASEDHDAIGRALQALGTDENLRSTLATSALARVRSRLTSEHWLDAHVDLYSQLLSKGGTDGARRVAH